MRAVSKKRAAQLRRYARQRALFLEAWPRCQYPEGCDQRATEVHHMRGRVGDLLCDEAWWMAICRTHHAYVTEHPAEAYEIGASYRRVGAA